MVIDECPGSKSLRQSVPEYHNCPECGEEVEIWSDELVRECSKCGTIVSRKQENSCIEWCNMAEKCVGEELYKKFRKDKS